MVDGTASQVLISGHSPGERGKSPLRFELIDSGESRSDLAVRRETKFTIDRNQIDLVRSLLQTNTRRLIHNEPISTVRSIYFDDARLSACHANLDGMGLRRKLRLRWYDQLLPGRDLFLEVKWRNNRVTGKHRLQLRASDDIGERPYDELTRALQSVVPERLLSDLLNNPEPVVVVEYRREHFASACGQLRVTIDYDIAFYRQFGCRRLKLEFPQRMNQLAVLEGKTPVGLEHELRALLYPLTLRAARCSKYVHGCQQLGLVD
jgi:hypothetical protein